MTHSIATVLVIGATGSIGRKVVETAQRHGLGVRAMVRDLDRGAAILPETDLVVGDITDPRSLSVAVEGVDAIVLTQGSSADGSPERIDYEGTRNVLHALGDLRPRLVLMTALYVTRPNHFLNEHGQVLSWRRRAERLVRASGLDYTIVRPGWFDRVEPGDDTLEFQQGDTSESGVGRAQIAEVIIRSLLSEAAVGKTFELVASRGSAWSNWDDRFAGLPPDAEGSVDAPLDNDTMPVSDESDTIRRELEAVRAAAHRARD